MKSGKGYIYSHDKWNRPCAYLHVSKHDKYNADLSSAQKLTVLTVETGRLAMKGENSLNIPFNPQCLDDIEDTTLVFDMTGFAIKNMDYEFT